MPPARNQIWRLAFVDAIDAAHDPGAFGDLVFHLPGLRIVEVQMIPAVAFRHPDDFAVSVGIA